MADARECRVIRNFVLNREPAKPAIGKVHLHLATQSSLRADRKRVADDEHPDHQRRINRRPPNLRVEGRQLCMYPRKVENGSNRSNRMILRHHLIKTKRIEKLALIVI
jgi:hypothetical protein